jgi:hypothetical protein
VQRECRLQNLGNKLERSLVDSMPVSEVNAADIDVLLTCFDGRPSYISTISVGDERPLFHVLQ